MWRRTFLSPVVMGLAAVAAGYPVARWIVPDQAEGVVIGAGAAALVGGVSALARRSRHATAESPLEVAEQRARTDPLTGLLNRSGLMEALTAALARARETDTCVGVLFSDLDRFKVVNDSLGHDAGDRLLVAVAERLRDAVRAADVVGRFGGDEFVVICHGLLEPGSIVHVAQTVRAAFDEPFTTTDGRLAIAPSIGVAVWDPKSGARMTAEDMMRDADAAMYDAKRSRAGISVFDREVRHALVAKLRIEQSLSRSLDSQLVVHYQPVIDAATDTVSGVEALVRWQHPHHGLLFPADFLPVAEEAGLMTKIGDLVLREACAQAAAWNSAHEVCRTIEMNVNVSEHQLLDATFPSRVADALAWSGLPPHQLCLEISEDLVTDHLEGSLPVLEQIARTGVKLSLDDFGTGRTTMSHLKRLNDVVHQVKIDRVFVDQLPDDPVDHAVVEAVARIADAANLTVIAEGVETSRQAEALLALGVRHHQGYLYSKAMEADRLELVFSGSGPSAPAEAGALAVS